MGYPERYKSLQQAFEYLTSKGYISTQKELARKMQATPQNVSRALSGDEKVVTEKFMTRLNLAMDGMFRIPWLLNGEGQMLADKNNRQIVTFEYNEEKDSFHENVGTSLENTRGYRTICKTTYQVWDPFRTRLRLIQDKGHKLTFNEVSDLWNNYINNYADIEESNESDEENKEGEYAKTNITSSEQPLKTEDFHDYSLVPLINIDSVGGMGSSNALAAGDQFVERLIPFTGAQEGDRAIYQSGDSMTPTIPAGSILQIRRVDDWREYFGYGGIFVLWLNDNRRITKQVMKYSPDPHNYVTCHSFNPDSADEELPKKFIREVWKVIKVLTDNGW